MWHSSLQHWGFASLLIKPEVVSTHVNAQVSYAAPASRIAEGLGFRTAPLYNVQTWGMDQYLLIPFLGKWTSIYQLFWCSPGVQGFDTLPWMNQTCTNMYILLYRQSESVGISRMPGSGGCGGGVLVAALTEHLQHQIHRGRCRRVALCTLWISVDLLWFFLWTPRPHAWTISFNCRKLSSQLRLGPSIDIDMKKTR